LSDTQRKYDELLESERDNPFIQYITSIGYPASSIAYMFSSGRFKPQDYSAEHGFHGSYEVATISRT
jgi:hypothetical protein